MFGPNINNEIKQKVDFHHREQKFMDLYKNVTNLFRKKFDITDNYEIIILTGSGTLAIEMFISSFKHKLRVISDDPENEIFAQRWIKLLKHYNKYDESSEYGISVQYETSESKYNQSDDKAVFVDAVSSFPFWPAPNSPAWTTVTSKLLGSVPVLSILVIKKDFLKDNFESSTSYLNPFPYVNFSKDNQTPTTPAIPLFQDFYEKLQAFDLDDLKKRIKINHKLLVEAIGEENLINPTLGPVLTLKDDAISKELAKKWSLYGYKSSGRIQIFLYSEDSKKYEQLAKDIQSEKQ